MTARVIKLLGLHLQIKAKSSPLNLCLTADSLLPWYMTKPLHFSFVCSENILTEILWLVEMETYKPKPAAMIFFCHKCLSLGNSSEKKKKKKTITVSAHKSCLFFY